MSRIPDLRRASAAAYRVLAAKKIGRLPVDPLLLLRACRHTAVYSETEAEDSLEVKPAELARMLDVSEAVTFSEFMDGCEHYVVLYRAGGNPARLRFTLAHELGHRVLGHRARERADEMEADCFASHLLCPEPVLDRIRREGPDRVAERIASACYVSIPCAKMALHRCAISEDEGAILQVKRLLSEIDG